VYRKTPYLIKLKEIDMLVKVNIPILTMDGEQMKDDDGQGNTVDATVKLAIVNAVLSPVQNEKGVEKVKKYELAKKVYASDEVDLTAEEISLIKERVGDVFAPIVVGQIFEMLRV
jgi:hypothetical protein